MVEKVTVRGNFDSQSGGTVVAGSITFTLTERDFDGVTIVEPKVQTVELNSDGSFAIDVWPNDRGVKDSKYRVDFKPDGGSAKTLEADLFVPGTGEPHHLTDLLVATHIASTSKVSALIPISDAEYGAKLAEGELKPDALYLIEAA